MLTNRFLQLLIVTALVVVIALTASPAFAIIGGEPDGDRHPYVGVLVDEFPFGSGAPKTRYCSGVLIAPRVLVTAAHCLDTLESDGYTLDDVWVSFDSIYQPGGSYLYHGTGVRHPEYNRNLHSFSLGDEPDIAVVHLDEAPPITPARLPTAGLLSSLDLRGQTFTAVGYGRTRIDRTKGPNNIEANLDPDVRNSATGEFRSLQQNWLSVSENPSTGDGGGCYGDSGGANYFGDSDVAVSVFSMSDGPCRSLLKGYRLDTDSARRFLASQGVPLP